MAKVIKINQNTINTIKVILWAVGIIALIIAFSFFWYEVVKSCNQMYREGII